MAKIKIASCRYLVHYVGFQVTINEYFDALFFVSRYAEKDKVSLFLSFPFTFLPLSLKESEHNRQTDDRRLYPWRRWRKSVQVHLPLRETANTDAAAALPRSHERKNEGVQQGRHERG